MKTVLFVIAVIACMTLILFFMGCSVVKTTELTKDKPEANIYYHLPKGMLKITSTAKIFVYTDKENNHLKNIELISQSFDHEREIVPDNRQTLKLNYVNNPLSKDDLDIKINDKGLLTNVDITTEDRLPNIIETLSKASAEILGIGAASKGADEFNVAVEEFTKIFILDPSDFPKDQAWIIAKNDKFGNSIDLDISFSIHSNNPPNSNTTSILTSQQEIKGILTRPLSLNKFSIFPKATMLDGHQVEFYEYLPNTELNITIPLSRAMFAKKINNLVLVDGLIKENKINKPSEVEGFISIPINLAKAIVSIPAQLFQFKIDNTKKKTEYETEFLNLENAITAIERNELLKSLETDRLKLDADKSLITLQKDLEILRNEITLLPQVSELENKKKIIGLEKEVNILTNDIKILNEKQVLENEKSILQLQKEVEILKRELENLNK